MKYAVIDSTNTVINLIIWDGVTDYTSPDGTLLVQTDTAGIGWTYNGTIFTNPSYPQGT